MAELDFSLKRGREAAIDGYIAEMREANPHMAAEIYGPPSLHHLQADPDAPRMRDYQEIELEVLRTAVINTELFQQLREIFVNHKYPDRLDPVGQMIRRVFINLENSNAKEEI